MNSVDDRDMPRTISAIDGENYAEAHQVTMKTGKPMLVMVSTEWCPACQVMKRRILPRTSSSTDFETSRLGLSQSGQRGRVVAAVDRQRSDSQLVMFRKTPRGWVRQVMVGSQPVESVEQFINQGIAAEGDDSDSSNVAEKTKAGDDTKPAEKPQQPKA